MIITNIVNDRVLNIFFVKTYKIIIYIETCNLNYFMPMQTCNKVMITITTVSLSWYVLRVLLLTVTAKEIKERIKFYYEQFARNCCIRKGYIIDLIITSISILLLHSNFEFGPTSIIRVIFIDFLSQW